MTGQDFKVEFVFLNMSWLQNLALNPMSDTQGVLNKCLPKDELCFRLIFTSYDAWLVVLAQVEI